MIRRRLGELLLFLGSLGMVALIAALAEVAARTWSSVDLVGNSRNLFVAKAWGESHGNAPNVEAISFGSRVYTDEYGFRIARDAGGEGGARHDAILLLGDSVGFGPAVDEPQTYAGLLRARFPERRIYNAAVIGYATRDYRNLVEAFVPAHPEVSVAVLVYCLNDVSTTSAQNIERLVKTPAEATPSLTEWLRSWTWISDANDYLRSRSKLYLLVRHRLLGTQTRDWKEVLQLYREDRADDLDQTVGDIAEVAALLSQRGIPLVVVIAPFEYQLRKPEDPDSQVPQRELTARMSRVGLEPVDARPAFAPDHPSSDYFLGYDVMHFSALGHRVMADVIDQALRAQRPTS